MTAEDRPATVVTWALTPEDAALVCEALAAYAGDIDGLSWAGPSVERLDVLHDQLDGLCP